MTRKTIGIFTRRTPRIPSWDPDSINLGLPGSEEALIYASQELANLGHQVYVFNKIPKGSKYGLADSNPLFTNCLYENHLPEGWHFDLIILWRAPEFVQFLKGRGKKIYFWPHDAPYHYVRDDIIDQFDDVLWLSSWQREQWIAMNPKFAQFPHIFGNGIQLDQFKEVKERDNPYACIYGSNYARGLSVLLDIWPSIKEAYPRATLDIYYGWEHWGAMSDVEEKNLRRLIAHSKKFDVKEHGLVGHKKLAEAYSQASFWTYPCIHPETFCITALKAQAAGAIPVIIDGSALTNIVRYGFRCSHKKEYRSVLLKALSQAETITIQQRKEMRQFILDAFTWKIIVSKWDAL